MPRTARRAGGMVFHVRNRNARAQIFDEDHDYHAFQRVLTDTLSPVPMRILAYCLMPNHWQFVLHLPSSGSTSEALTVVGGSDLLLGNRTYPLFFFSSLPAVKVNISSQ